MEQFLIDLWVNDEGRVVRLDQGFELPAPDWELQAQTVHNSMTLSDFGPPITVAAPAG